MAHLHLTLLPDPSELVPLRARVRSYLADLQEPAADWLLIATEVTTNAIEASPEGGTVEVSMRADDERIEFVVTDDGPGFGLAAPTSVGAESRRGRGLMIVSALAKRLAVSRVAGRTVTQVERPRAERVDVVVIGLGSAGEAAARALAGAGRTVVGFERDDTDTELARELTDAGVELVRSKAKLIGPNLVEADGKAWYGDHVLLASGTAPIVPDIEGLEPDHIPDLDDQRRVVGHPWLHVLGNLNGLHRWTHGANRDAEIVVADILGRSRSTDS